MKPNLIRDRSYGFALEAVRLHRRLRVDERVVLGRQMLRSATSVGANVEEALGAQSRRDFVAKLSIARKEARECHYWLRSIRDSGTAAPEAVRPLIVEAAALVKILTSIILSTRAGSDPEIPHSNS